MNSPDGGNGFSLRGARPASFVLLALALSAGVFTGRSGATLAGGGKVTGTSNLPGAKPAVICTLGTNLIINGGAEADPAATGDGFADHDLSAWENEAGEFTVARYDAPGGFPTSAGPGPTDRGTFLFVAGYAETSHASQVVDLSSCSSQIDGGTLLFNLSAFLGGFGPQNDSARVILTFKDAANVSLGTAAVGPVLAAERNGITGLFERATVGAVPVGALRWKCSSSCHAFRACTTTATPTTSRSS